MEESSPTKYAWRWFAVLLAASFIVGLPAIDAPYFDDDFQFVFETPALNPVHYFMHGNAHNNFYRPIQSAFLAAVQSVWGLTTTPVHLVQIVLHASLAMLVFTAMLGLGFRRRDGIVASLLVATSQTAVMAVSSNDTLSQLLGVLAGYLAVWTFYRFARDHRSSTGLGDRRYLAGMGWLAISFFSKETSAAFVLLGPLALLAGMGGIRDGAQSVRVFATRAAPLVILLAVYIAIRAAVASATPEIGEGRYGIALGPNIIKNIGLLWVTATIPFSSMDMFAAVSTGDRATLGMFGLVYAAFAAIVVAGLWRYRRDARLWWLFAVALVSVSSIVPINHVSELYSYQLLPAAAAIVALGLGALGDAARRNRPTRVAWIIVVVAVIASNAIAAYTKTRMINESGQRAAVLLEAVVPHARDLAPGGELVLVNPESDAVEYSMFRFSGFNYLRHTDFYIARLAGRDDITVRIVPAGEPAPQPGPERIVLVLDQDTVTQSGTTP